MPANKLHQTAADYVTIVLSPVLIMALIGSLVFFLVEVLQGGQLYGGRLKYVFFWFVFGIVLVARMAMHPAVGERAKLYGLGLSVVVYLGLQRFISLDYLFGDTGTVGAFDWAINLGLIALVWWCAHRLVWDCTYIDDAVDASGQGVLQAAGLDEEGPVTPEAVEAEEEEKAAEEEQRRRDEEGLLGWVARYRRYREAQKRRPHTPGVWVVYFSFAALPLFGLGQALLPLSDTERRQSTFWLLACYVASALALLLTTSFLGLRRYLRQRKLQMPVAITGTWLVLGGVLIFGLLVASVLLPRPHAEYALTQLMPAGAKERDASRFATNTDSAGKGEGKASTDQPPPDHKAEQGSGTKADPQGKGEKKGKGSGSKSDSNAKGSGDNRSNDKSSGNDRKGQDAKERKSDNDNQQGSQNKSRSEEDKKKNGSRPSLPDEKDKEKTEGSKSPSDKDRDSSSSDRLQGLTSLLTKLATVLKWLVFAVLALVVLFFGFQALLRFLANFTGWAGRWLEMLQGLFSGWGQGGGTDTEADEEVEAAPRPRPFTAFSNPFLDGTAGQRRPEEIVSYTFEALEAWAWERDLARSSQETPLEFAARLDDEVPALEDGAQQLANLYARVAYARGTLAAPALAPLKALWQRLETTAGKALSV